jgi:hypothetical protein
MSVIGAVAAAMAAWSAVPARAGTGPGPVLPAVMKTEYQDAIDKGLAFLAKNQQPDGSYSAMWNASNYSAAMTSLAGMAFMAGGSTPEDGPYSENVKKAMLYLLGLAREDGLIAGKDEKRNTYGHGFAIQFLANCYGAEQGTENEKRIREVLDKAIGILYRGQSGRASSGGEGAGGWLYTPTSGGDEGSTTGVVLTGLRAARNAGIKVPKEMIDKAVGYLRFTQNPDGGIAYSAAFRGASRPALAAQALACFYAAGIYDRDATKGGMINAETIMVDKLWRYINSVGKNSEDIKGFYFYHHYFLSQAMYRRGGKDWEAYYHEIAKELASTQQKNGSWIGDDVGPVYATALGSIILQLPYAYLPICER